MDVQLYANGKKSGDVVTLTAANKWTYTWRNLAEKSK
ncbi:Cna B-type domain-containing protein [uncultured Streptococcus sp.]|nr:Cna B-type domain-containing protein [uncultured Streptococcus sp.]